MDERLDSEREIDRLRRSLGKVDLQLLDLLNRRMEIARDIGEWKRRNELLIFDPFREEAVIADLIRRNAGFLSDRAIRAIFQEIFSSARAQQGILRIGCAAGAIGLLAAHSRFGASDLFRVVRSAAEGQRLLIARAIDLLVLPKEDLLRLPALLQRKFDIQPPYSICGEIARPHALRRGRVASSGFYIVRLGADLPAAPELLNASKWVFLLVGAPEKSIDRWTDRLGGCWIETRARPKGRASSDAGDRAGLWEASTPLPPEALRSHCREICGDSAWIVRLGAYPIS